MRYSSGGDAAHFMQGDLTISGSTTMTNRVFAKSADVLLQQ
jgi:hypothetical protein